MSDSQDKARAIFFSAIMVLSVIAIGGVGFVGSAAADSTSTGTAFSDSQVVSNNGQKGGQVSPGESLNFTNITYQAGGPSGIPGTLTSVRISSNANLDGENITTIRVYKNASADGGGPSGPGTLLGENTSVSTLPTNVSFVDENGAGGQQVLNETFGYTVEVEFASDAQLRNNTLTTLQSEAFNASNGPEGSGFDGGNSTNPADLSGISSSGDVEVNVGNASVVNFQQFGKDNRVNFNFSVITPQDNANGVDESSISVALNNSDKGATPRNSTNVTVIDNGTITSVAQDNSTQKDLSGGNVTYDIDVALPEEEQGGYNVTLLGNITDDGGNIIEYAPGAKNITRGSATTPSLYAPNNKYRASSPGGGGGATYGGTGTFVNMTPTDLQVTADSPVFANSDAGTASDSGATIDENATVNVTVVDRFGNGLNTTGGLNASVSLDANVSSTAFTSINTSQRSNSERAGPQIRGLGIRGQPFHYNVSNSFASDVEISADDGSVDDTIITSGSAVQTFVASIGGVTFSTNRSALPADDSTPVKVSAQLTDGNGNSVAVPNVQVDFASAGGFKPAGAEFRNNINKPKTDASGVASVNITADTAGQTFTVKATEQKNGNSNTLDINTTAGQISDTNTKFLFNGSLVSQGGIGSITRPVGTSHDLSVRVLDSSSNPNPVESASVTYTLDGETVATASSDSNGYANTTITLSNQRITNAQLNASVDPFNASAASQAGPGAAQVNISTNATAATQLQFGSDARALPIDSSGKVDVEVVDEFGNVNESVSQDVTLESSDTSVLNFSGNAQSNSKSLDDNNGAVTFDVQTADSAGSATLTAFTSGSGISNASDTFSVNEPASVEVTFDNDVSTSSSDSTKQIANLSAQLKGPDGSDLAVGNTQINFAQVSGSAAELNQSRENFQNSTNPSGVATIQVNATSETGDTTFRAVTSGGASGEGTITTTGSRNAIQLTPTSSTVTENNSVNVTATFVDSEGRVVPRTDSITVTPTLGSVGTSQQSTTFDSNGEANVVFNYTADGGTGEDTLDAIGGAVTGTTNITVEAAGGSGGDGPDVNGDGNPAKDTDGDGKFEDVNGDNATNIGDVQALINGIDTGAVNDGDAGFNFNNDNQTNVNIGDVQALINEI